MTWKMFTDLLLAAVLIGVAVAIVSSLTACGHPYKSSVGEYKQDSVRPEPETVVHFRDKVVEPKPTSDDKVAKLEAKIDVLQDTVNRFMEYQTKATAVQVHDRAMQVKREECTKFCDENTPKQSYDEKVDWDSTVRGKCFKQCDKYRVPGQGFEC